MPMTDTQPRPDSLAICPHCRIEAAFVPAGEDIPPAFRDAHGPDKCKPNPDRTEIPPQVEIALWQTLVNLPLTCPQ